jgi:hypothetical protein
MDLQTALPDLNIPPHPYRAQVVEALAQFRQEWQELASHQSLIEMQTPVGLLLYDVGQRMGLSPQEQFILLGASLSREVQEFLDQQVMQVE